MTCSRFLPDLPGTGAQLVVARMVKLLGWNERVGVFIYDIECEYCILICFYIYYWCKWVYIYILYILWYRYTLSYMCIWGGAGKSERFVMPFAEVECLRDVGVQCARDGPCACCCKIRSILFTLMGTNISPQKKQYWRWCFVFPRGGLLIPRRVTNVKKVEGFDKTK